MNIRHQKERHQIIFYQISKHRGLSFRLKSHLFVYQISLPTIELDIQCVDLKLFNKFKNQISSLEFSHLTFEKVLSLKFPLKHKYLREIRNFPLINTILKLFIWKPWLNTILIHLTSDVQTYQILMFCIWFYTFPAKANKCFQIFMNKTWNAYYAPKLL